jgi:ATP-dependent DNA helicase RecG
MNNSQVSQLLPELLALPGEAEWVEFKLNNDNSEEIGEYISAIANSAALHGKKNGYIIWGIDDVGHAVKGTTFKPRQTKIGNEELENWLGRLLSPRLDFRIHEFLHNQLPVVMFIIPPAFHTPVSFRGTEYIRVGTYKKKLRDYPEKERTLWAMFQNHCFEKGIAAADQSSDDVLLSIDYPSFFNLLGQPLPDNRAGILDRLQKEKVVVDKKNGLFDITNLGALLFAHTLERYEGLARKALRVIQYKDESRIQTLKEHVSVKGYAVGFEELISYINSQLPQNEVIGKALRDEVRMFPEIAIRELVANALIHQDYSLSGTGPMVEIFPERIEITNPGTPLIDTLRFIDEPPQSRNEALAALMRRLKICEERGSGIDKVISAIELFQLPAPDFQATSNHTKAILFAHRKLSKMDSKDRIRACYQHACLCWISGKTMTNTTLRERFGIEEKNAAIASRIISETISAGLIKTKEKQSKSRKHASYIPFWL